MRVSAAATATQVKSRFSASLHRPCQQAESSQPYRSLGLGLRIRLNLGDYPITLIPEPSIALLHFTSLYRARTQLPPRSSLLFDLFFFCSCSHSACMRLLQAKRKLKRKEKKKKRKRSPRRLVAGEEGGGRFARSPIVSPFAAATRRHSGGTKLWLNLKDQFDAPHSGRPLTTLTLYGTILLKAFRFGRLAAAALFPPLPLVTV